MLWEPDRGDCAVEATLLFDHQHPMTFKPALWARAKADLDRNAIQDAAGWMQGSR